MSKYRSIVTDLDHCFKCEGGIGYKSLTFCTSIILGMLVYGTWLDITFSHLR